jgi:hypothetical protein
MFVFPISANIIFNPLSENQDPLFVQGDGLEARLSTEVVSRGHDIIIRGQSKILDCSFGIRISVPE